MSLGIAIVLLITIIGILIKKKSRTGENDKNS